MDKDKALDTVADANVDLLHGVTQLVETNGADTLPIAEAAAQFNSVDMVDAVDTLERATESD